ncbi:hypothetical protein [Mesoplasma seiffertii]|uniref:hypothetical protein n=1 Tax=Mesoplasma seiffertii TaxID=28224 RepID=UPI00047E9DA4|nr:hypothetical protein [Mesoplasma seiffertii]
MIEIKKIKNWYGINELVNSNLIVGNTIIYAPNGVMKTSFAEGIKKLSVNSKPYDLFNEIESEFEIICNDKIFDNKSESFKIEAIVFSGDELDNEIFSKDSVAKLLVSKKLKEKYNSEIIKIESDIDAVKRLIYNSVIGSSKYKEKDVSFLIEDEEKKETTEINSILSFIEKISDKVIKEDISKIKILDLFNDKTEKIFEDKNFIEKALSYKKIIKQPVDKNIFKKGFTFDNLISINKSLVDNNFFKAENSVNISNITYTEVELQNLIKVNEHLIYGSNEAKQIFDEAKKILEKKSNSKLLNLVIENDWLLPLLSDPSDLKRTFINTKCFPFLNEFEEYKNKLLEAKKAIEDIFESASLDNTKWKEVVDIYNQRFFDSNFELEIKDAKEAILDLTVPSISIKLKNTSIDITDKIKKRFSSGEKKSMYILSLIFEIEVAKQEEKDCVIILDDIVESFDYKNKYSTLEYLKDISRYSQNQLIILTHNFDFFRSCILSIGSGLESKLFAYKISNKVELIDAKSKEFIDFSFIKNWKNRKSTEALIALLPFIRNIYEIKDGSQNKNYIDICNFLHFNNKSEEINLKELDAVFKEMNVSLSSDYDDNTYFEKLKKQALNIMRSKPSEKDLMKKIIMGIFIRVATDKMLLENYKIHNNQNSPQIEGNNWTAGLYKITKDKLSSQEIEIYNSSIVVAPSFIHVNGFMYEPLVDIGFEKLIKVAQNLYDYLSLKKYNN